MKPLFLNWLFSFFNKSKSWVQAYLVLNSVVFVHSADGNILSFGWWAGGSAWLALFVLCKSQQELIKTLTKNQRLKWRWSPKLKVMETDFQSNSEHVPKGQEISKQNCRAVTSPKIRMKWTQETCFEIKAEIQKEHFENYKCSVCKFPGKHDLESSWRVTARTAVFQMG